MSHEVTPATDHLEFPHKVIMAEILKVIGKQTPFIVRENVSTLGLDCINVAREVYSKLSSYRSLDDLVKSGKGNYDTFGAFPLQDNDLKKSVDDIYKTLQAQIDHISPTLLAQIVKSSAELNDNDKKNIFSLEPQSPPFQSKEGNLQPVSMGDQKSGEKLFRAHLCKIQMTSGISVHDALQKAISTHYDNLVQAEAEIEDKAEALSEINRQLKKIFDDPDNNAIIGLRQLLDQETSGLVKREAGIAYLEYLLANAKQQGTNFQALERIINNIRWVEDYSHQIRNRNEYCVYQVTDEHSYDLRELLGYADAFNNLPVIGLIDGNIEERTGEKEQTFVFGIRFKANNPITAPDKDFPELKNSPSVYAYHLTKAIKVLERAKQFNTTRGEYPPDYYNPLRLLGRSIRTVFLYYMVFSDHPQKITWWEQTATLLHNRDPKALDKLLALAKTMRDKESKLTQETITPALNTLKTILANKTKGLKGTRQCLILLDKSLVKNDIFDATEGDIFISDLQTSANQDRNALKKCLQYVRIVNAGSAPKPDEFLHSMSFQLSFYDTFFLCG
ncbi:conserved hypothetical protein [Beggiatoa sp. PS]|nr:conserved hypothetical protein [Beggiatoa sp. PS]